MMRSLWAGVTGLQAHQIAMDVEGNNIANVNTAGFKYSRANFSDLLSQTAKIATAPQGELGGKNPMQIGLGTQISSVTKIFKQGSVQVTDKNTDLAIQGDGFFVVSPDGGSTYKYTRNGDFTFDAQGNFTEGNGYIIQGWVRDAQTGEIDATTPIQNITIPPGLTTPANDTSYITLKANLNSGNNIVNKSSIYTLDANAGWIDSDGDGLQNPNEIHNENDIGQDIFNTDKALYERGQDLGALFNANGEAFNLENNQGVWISYAEARTQTLPLTAHVSGTTNVDLNINGTSITGSIVSLDDNIVATYIATIINEKTALTGVQAQISGGNDIYLTNTNKSGTENTTKNIKITKGATDLTQFTDTSVITAYKYTYSKTPLNTTYTYDDAQQRTFTTTEDLRAAIQTDARLHVDYTNDGVEDKNDGVEVIINEQGQFQISNPTGDALNHNDGDITTTGDITTRTGTLLSSDLSTEAISFPVGTIFTETITPSANVIINGVEYGPTGAGGPTIPAGTTLTTAATLPIGTTVADTGNDMTLQVGTNYLSANDFNMYISVTALSDASNKVSQNDRFTTTMAALQGTLNSGTGIRTTQNIYAASHASSIDVYDSLGSKHTVRFEFTKTGYTDDGGTEWSILISVPEPGDINLGSYPKNIVTGTISFNSDGSLATFSPTNLTYTANNGSTPNQNIEINFGTLSQFDGMTSFDAQSNTSGISQDGYPGGDLAGIRVDETGTLIGSFTNGRSFGLAQVAMAKFTNNEGLESDGGNTFIQTSNSGDPIIGQAAIGGRGFIQASSLEMSNVDLSRSLTQLIVVQRGYQANSKTITTSDQMLNTLLQLKQ
ncbi:MAG: flagellar hook protein FlgE [Sulfurospirillum sp.]|nr:flagellar hook protein FlgE [Sulfurospirillum sp.]